MGSRVHACERPTILRPGAFARKDHFLIGRLRWASYKGRRRQTCLCSISLSSLLNLAHPQPSLTFGDESHWDCVPGQMRLNQYFRRDWRRKPHWWKELKVLLWIRCHRSVSFYAEGCPWQGPNLPLSHIPADEYRQRPVLSPRHPPCWIVLIAALNLCPGGFGQGCQISPALTRTLNRQI
jgi:hypothetical protein